jgi:hypothetical protein
MPASVRTAARTGLALALLAAVLTLPGPTAGQSATRVLGVTPVPNAVVTAGAVVIAAEVEGPAPVVRLDGVELGPLPPEGVAAQLPPGHHVLELLDAGRPLLAWGVDAAPVSAVDLGRDPLAVALAASGVTALADGRPGRPVVVAPVDHPAIAVVSGPLAVALGAAVIPVSGGPLPQANLDAARAIAGEGGRAVVLGGPEVVASQVDDQLAGAGVRVERVGGTSAPEVAAAAAELAPAADRYDRAGRPVPRPVVVAPATPLAAAVAAAGLAARERAALLLADDGLVEAAARVVASRRAVLLAESLTEPARQAVRDAADPAAEVAVRVSAPPPPAAGTAAPPAWVVDAATDPALAVLAPRAGGAGAVVLPDPVTARAWVAAARPDVVRTAGAVEAPQVAAWVVDGPEAPVAAVEVEPDGRRVRLLADRPLDAADVHVSLLGRTWPGTWSVDGHVVTWTAAARPPLPSEVEAGLPGDLPLRVSAAVQADDRRGLVAAARAVAVAPPTTTAPEGFIVAGGASAVVGTGPLRTFTVEVEPATGLDVHAVAAEATGILLDATRGWTARGERSMQRVADPAAAAIRVVVATPATVDRFCGRVGLDTGGRLSCWDGRRAMLNLTRWQTGVAPFHTDLEVYRRYLVSHEVGHGLGYGHVGCPAAGALAPVMVQQSKGLFGCRPNGWPYP